MRATEVSLKHVLFVAAALIGGCGDDRDPTSSAVHDAGRDGGALYDAGDRGADAARDGAARDGWQPPQLSEIALPDADDDRPLHLSEVGLYRDLAHKTLAPDLLAFEPKYKLWSDGADKRRWLRLPPGTRIDTSNVDHWVFPVGTMLFKEFSLGGKRLETRLVARTGPGERDYWMGAFLWNDDESDAVFVRDGAADVRGTDHDVPKSKNCLTCHDGEAGRVLGFSAIQQPDAPADMLSDPPAVPAHIPGDAIASAALGYLHANCGHCHNENGAARPDTDMLLRVSAGAERPEDTDTYKTTVGVEMQYFEGSPLTLRIDAGDAEHSGVFFRMSQRGPKTQMPPLATEFVDDDGIASVRAWIESL
jgi:mono/diheme cytochrome c family protein